MKLIIKEKFYAVVLENHQGDTPVGVIHTTKTIGQARQVIAEMAQLNRATLLHQYTEFITKKASREIYVGASRRFYITKIRIHLHVDDYYAVLFVEGHKGNSDATRDHPQFMKLWKAIEDPNKLQGLYDAYYNTQAKKTIWRFTT